MTLRKRWRWSIDAAEASAAPCWPIRLSLIKRDTERGRGYQRAGKALKRMLESRWEVIVAVEQWKTSHGLCKYKLRVRNSYSSSFLKRNS